MTLAERIRSHAAEARAIAALMLLRGGYAFEIHAEELIGSARMLEQWVLSLGREEL